MNKEILRKIDRIHPYPAKYTIDFALDCIEKYSEENDLIFDPFVGSGTTLMAASILNRKSIGTDVNYIAILISKFKLLKLNHREIADLQKFILNIKEEYFDKISCVEQFYYESINHWFCQNSIKFLSYIKKKNEQLENKKERIFCELIMSAIINVVSNQESDTRYAAIEKKNLTINNIANIYINKFNQILDIFKKYNEEKRNCKNNKPYLLDARNCISVLKSKSVDLILTSPPYINTYDYYLYHKHRMNWLDFDVKYSMNFEIGSRREYSSLKHNTSKFNDDVFGVFQICDKVIKTNGHIVIVIGDGQVSGELYDAKKNFEEISKKLDWKLSDYSYSLLDDTSRSFQKSYRTNGKKEHIMVFTKGDYSEN